MFGDQPLQCRQVFANVRSFECRKPLSRDPKRIAHRQSDAFFAQIKRKDAPFACFCVVFHCLSNYSDRQVVVPVSSTQRSLQVGVSILALGAGIALLYFGRIFFVTVIIAAMIAFLLEPLVELFMKARLPRGVASFAVCSISLMFLYLAGLGLYTESVAMLEDLPAYGERISELVDHVTTRIEAFETAMYKTLVPK